MHSLIYFFVSGRAFLAGGSLLILALLIGPPLGRRLRLVSWLLGLIGVIFMVLSATPLSGSADKAMGMAVAIWLFAYACRERTRMIMAAYARYYLVVVLLLMVAMEWQYQRPPIFLRDYYPQLYVVGDSISAGLGSTERPWPQLLADRQHVTVVNLARVGATLDTAIDEARRIQTKQNYILLEIGGNDLLRQHSPAQFRADLRRLFEVVCQRGNMVVMLELPLPPFANAYGAAQRELAQEFGVLLIPKRYFAEILAYNSSASGDLHLSPSSHEKMADMIWSFIQPFETPVPAPGQTLAHGS